MKRIITAIGNEMLNKQLSLFNDVEIKGKDILYKEGVIEFLEKDEEVDIVIFNEKLCGDDLITFLNEINKYNVEIYLLLKEENYYYEEFEKLKNIKIFRFEEDIIEIFKNHKYLNSNFENYKLKKNKRVISILGPYGVGKTIFCSLVGKMLSKNSKILIIDFDIFSNNLKYLFDSKNTVNSHDLDSLIYKVSRNLYLLSGIKYIFNETNKIDSYKVKELLDKLKMNFEYIIIDTSSEVNLKFIKTLFPNCDYNIFLIEANSLEVKKAKELLEVYLLDFNLDSEKIGIFINKYNINSIDIEIIKNIFKDFKIIGKINYTPKVNSYINTYTKNNIKIDDIRRIQKIFKGDGVNG